MDSGEFGRAGVERPNGPGAPDSIPPHAGLSGFIPGSGSFTQHDDVKHLTIHAVYRGFQPEFDRHEAELRAFLSGASS